MWNIRKFLAVLLTFSVSITMFTGFSVSVSADTVEGYSTAPMVNTIAGEEIIPEVTEPNSSSANTALNYTLFSNSSSVDLRLHGHRINIQGDVYTGSNFRFAGSELYLDGRLDAVKSIMTCGRNVTIGSRNEAAPVVAMPDLNEIILDRANPYVTYDGNKTFQKKDVFQDESIMVQDSVKFNGSTFAGTCYVIADQDITYNVNAKTVQNGSQVVLYSQNGDITICGTDVVFNGILYAPNGSVRINACSFTLNGRIITEDFSFCGCEFNAIGSPNDLNLLNKAPIVDAGIDAEINLADILQLNGVVSDDTLLYLVPDTTWEQVSGPGVAEFSDNTSSVSTVIFSEPGTYELKLSAFDGLLETSDTLTVVVLDNAVFKTYMTDEDFNEGTLTNIVTDESSIKIDDTTSSLHFMWVAISTKGTVVKINTQTGEIMGEYRTAPAGQPTNPSRTTVDNDGNVWVANRDGNSVIKIGLEENGGWIDKNGNGVCDTSTGLGDVLAWSNTGGANTLGGTSLAEDECILLYVKVSSNGTRHISVDENNDVWVSGIGSRVFNLLDGETGAILRTEGSVGYGGYGGLIDGNGVIWSANPLLRWDTSKPLSGTNGVNWTGYSNPSYGLAIDSKGNVWNTSLGNGTIRKYNPAGQLIGTYNQGNAYAQGCAIDKQDNVWVAHSLYRSTIGRLNSDGTYIGTIQVKPGPTGVAVDSDGYIWAVCISGYVQKIDPNAGPIGADGHTPVGAVIYTSQYLGGELYNYSDMTGSTLTGAPKTATWSAVYDSEKEDTEWGKISWKGEVYNDGSIKVLVSTSVDNITFSEQIAVNNGDDFVLPDGRYVKLEVQFSRSSDGYSPTIDEITIASKSYRLEKPVNQAPSIEVMEAISAFKDIPYELHAMVVEDAFFSGEKVEMLWTCEDSSVSFSDDTVSNPSVTFSQVGTFTLTLAANDSVLSSEAQVIVTVTVQDLEYPVVSIATDKEEYFMGETLTATVTASDNVALKDVSLWVNGSKVVLDEDFSYEMNLNAEGDITFEAFATDTSDLVSQTAKTITVLNPDTTPPTLFAELAASNVFVGDPVALTITASDDRGSVAISTFASSGGVDETVGVYTYTATEAGTHQITVTATDEAGNKTTVTLSIDAVDKNTDPTSPDVLFTGITDGQIVSAPTDIIGTVTEGGLDYYVLEYAAAGDTTFTEFARGTQAVDNGVLGTFDPTLLNNGWYTIRISGYGLTEVSTTDVVVCVEGQMKIGIFSIAFQDMSFPVGSFPLTVIREYDSRDRSVLGDFGYGWNLGMSGVKVSESVNPGTYWNQERTGSGISIKYNITEDKPHTVSVDWGNGQIDNFDLKLTPSFQPLAPITYEISASYAAQAGTTSTLEAMGTTTGLMYNDGTLYDLDMSVYNPTTYKLTKADGTVYILDDTTGVESITYTDGTVITMDEDGIYHSDGKSIVFERDSEGKITQITDPNGNTTTYQYDANGNLTGVIGIAGETTTFEYDSRHYLTAIIDPRGVTVSRNEYDDAGRIVAVIDADGNRVEFTHDIDGRQEIIQDRLGNVTVYIYDERGNVLSETDALGHTTTYVYDQNDNRISKTDALGNEVTFAYDDDCNMLSYTDVYGNILSNTYSAKGQLTSMATLGVTQLVISYDEIGNAMSTTDAQGNVISYDYDAKSRVTGITDEIGQLVTFTYDTEGRPITATNGLGETSTFTYDAEGRCSSRSQNKTTDAGEVVITEHFTYDAAGHMTQIIYADGAVTKTEYNAIGKLSATVDSKDRRTTYEYDLFGNLSKITYCDNTTETFAYDKEGRNTAATDRMGRTVTMSYDAVGNLKTMTYPNGAKISYTYDAKYRLTSMTSVNGGITTYEYDALDRNTAIIDPYGNRTTFGYNALSQLTSMTDAKGNTYGYEYDLNGNRTKMTLPDGNSISTAYDARGRVTSVTDQHGYSTSYTYDTVDRLTAVTDAAGNTWNYTYNELNELTAVEDSNGNTTRYTYDVVGRVVQTTNAMGAVASMTYDEAGNIVTSTDYAGIATSYTYDDLDRMLSKTIGGSTTHFAYNIDGLLTTVIDDQGTTWYTYDQMNGLTDIKYPDWTSIHYVYDDAFRLTSVQTTYGTTGYTYDQMNRMTSVTDLDGAVTSYTYDANGNRSSMTYANDVTTSYTYDSCNRLIGETITNGTGNVIESYTITLGAAGERTQIVETNRTVSYAYDSLYRLTQETITTTDTTSVTSYTYDAMGNRLTKTTDGVITTYTYNALNQLISENDINYTYDTNGNQVAQEGPAKSAAYSYDPQGRLIRADVTTGGITTTEQYTYNWTGIRNSKTTDGVETKYLIDPNGSLSQVLAELDSAGNLVTFYTRGVELISLHRTGETRYYLYDPNGSVRILTDDIGAVTDTYTYDAFGNLLAKTGTTINSFMYSGEQFDANTGFYYLRARYMNPSTGTFISMDPAQGSIFDPISLHKYLYANANPVMNRDPSGRFTLSEEMCVLGMQSAFANFTLTLIDICRQGDAYEGDIGTDLFKSAVSGFIAGYVGGYLSPFFKGAGFMASGPIALKLRSLCLVALMVAMVGAVCKVLAEEVTPEGRVEDMSSKDLAMLAVGFFFDTLGDVACAPIKEILIGKDVYIFIVDFFMSVFVSPEEEKASA